jgi:methionyl-tRNA formyltransferase
LCIKNSKHKKWIKAMNNLESNIKNHKKAIPRVFFLGSGDIAVAPLAKLHKSEKIDLIGVATQEDRPAGRKRHLMPTPVGLWAAENGVEIDKPASVNSSEFIEKLHLLKPDIIFVLSFGQILKKEILNLPEIAPVNLHASLLPLYRGASPIAAALLNGDKSTGITFMKMDEGLDTGDEYCRFEYKITDEKADELEIALANLSADHIEDVLAKIANNEYPLIPQNNEKATYAGKIKKSAGIIDWNEPAEKIVAKLRAYHPWPGVSFTYQTPKRPIKITITDAEALPGPSEILPGEKIKANKSGWEIATGKGALSIKRLKPEGKGEMTAAEFVRGRPELLKNN